MISTEEMGGLGGEDVPDINATRPVLTVCSSVARQANYYLAAKRVIDLICGLVFLAILFPVFVVIAVLIAGRDGMPILFKHKRVGKNNQEFFVLKFRTMRKDAEKYLEDHPLLYAQFAESFKLDEDPRVTKLGRWLRKTSLDELPQLLNVVIGNMSLVGPRPVVREELCKYGSDVETYLSLKPGCAGLWQCSGRSDTSYPERVQLDLEYARKANLIYDLQLFLSTVVAIVNRHGAR